MTIPDLPAELPDDLPGDGDDGPLLPYQEPTGDSQDGVDAPEIDQDAPVEDPEVEA